MWDAPVHYECPGDGFVTGMGSYHDNDKEDRRFKFQCCEVQGKRLTSVIFNVTRTLSIAFRHFPPNSAHSEHRFPALSSKLCTLRALLSGTFLQTLHTPSIAFRHFPPNSAKTAHSEHRFPALSSKLC